MVTRQFRPALLPWLVVAVILPGLIWLGTWQYERYVDRAAEHARFNQAATDFEALATLDVANASDYAWVEAYGRFDGQRQFLIDNMVRQSRNGFFVITPFVLRDKRWILVNRGWVPQDPARRLLPDIDVEESEISLRGRLGKLPSGGLKLAGGDPPENEWPSIRQFPSIAELSEALEVSLLDKIVLLNPTADHGYVREWQPGGLPPARHLGYAVQWFALAITLLVIALVMSFRKVSND